MSGEPYWYEAHPDGFALVRSAVGKGDPEIVCVMKEVSVAYTFDGRGSYITHKHGTTETVLAWASTTRAQLKEALGKDHDHLFATMDPRVVTTDKWEVEDLNWAIQNINGLNRLARKFGDLGLAL